LRRGQQSASVFGVMGKRCPPPRPVALHRLAGTYYATRHGSRAAEPPAPGELRDEKPPRRLSARQRAIWRDILKRAAGVAGDRPRGPGAVVSSSSTAISGQRAAAAQAQLDAGEGLPLVVRDPSGLVPWPYLGIMTRTSLVMVRLARGDGLHAERARQARAARGAAAAGG
jgi:hypothetical protein